MRTLLVGIFTLLVSELATAGLGTAVEFYNASLNHYFVTAYPEEAAALDAGTSVKGWTRTGGQFTVFTDPAPGLSAVCRFFGTPGVGPNSHFYTADAAECAKVKTLRAWTFEAIAFYIPTPTDGDCGGNWPVYRSYYTDNISDANHRFTVDLTAHVRMPQRRGDVLEGVVMCAPVTDEEREADVVRFLEQATLGPTEALVTEVKAKGIEKWLDEQLAMNVTRYTQLPFFERPEPGQCVDDMTPPITPEKYCFTNKSSPFPVGLEFYRQSKTAPDQLRLRMAHVWHQIFVISFDFAYAHAEFQQRLRDGAFGTFDSLLVKYALAPQLGTFQNWIQNVPEHDGIKPNENFARELMQLFTIGVYELNSDGTYKRDATGQRISTYGQSDIAGMARILTGFTFGPKPGSPSTWPNPEYRIGDMVGFDDFHDRGSKTILGGRIAFGAGGGAMAEVGGALHALVGHPNAPPFIVKQLIQKTVTSSPTPGYVDRVAAVFRDNGKGVRGDLAAVTKAILLDAEARGARKIDAEYGRLREPALLWTAMIRALDATTDGFNPYMAASQSGQSLFYPPTVFNYYPADYTLAGGDIPAPEFGIFSGIDFIERANQVGDLIYSDQFPGQAADWWGPHPYVVNATGTPTPLLSAFLPDAGDATALVERMNRLFLHGAMRPEMRKTIVNALSKVATEDALLKVKMAINLTLASPDYQVQK